MEQVVRDFAITTILEPNSRHLAEACRLLRRLYPDLRVDRHGFRASQLGGLLSRANLFDIRYDAGDPTRVADLHARVIYQGLEDLYGPLSRRDLKSALDPVTFRRWRLIAEALATLGRALLVRVPVVFHGREFYEGEGIVLPVFGASGIEQILFLHDMILRPAEASEL